MPIPQVTIFLQNGRFYAEAPGKNGARRKTELDASFASRNPEIADDLRDQDEANRLAQRAELRATQNNNIKYVSEAHGIPTAKRVWPEADLIFNRSLQRALTATNLSGERATSNANAKPKSQAQAVDLDDLPVLPFSPATVAIITH